MNRASGEMKSNDHVRLSKWGSMARVVMVASYTSRPRGSRYHVIPVSPGPRALPATLQGLGAKLFLDASNVKPLCSSQ